MTTQLEHWEEEDGALVQTFKCESFKDAIDLINKIAIVADEMNHHPDLCIHDFKFVSAVLKTHDKDAITEKDYELAERIDSLVI